jgi:hypothetical protein
MCIEMEFATRLIKELESQCVLFGIALRDSEITALLQEDATVGQQRKELRHRISILQQSLDALLDTASQQSITTA